MKVEDSAVTGTQEAEHKGTIALKLIASILWIIVFAGMVVGGVMLVLVKDDLETQFAKDSRHIALLIEQQTIATPIAEKIETKIKRAFIPQFDFIAIQFILDGETVMIISDADLYAASSAVEIEAYPLQVLYDRTGRSHHLQVFVYHPPIMKVIELNRATWMMAIGVPMLVAALLLFLLLRWIVTQPIQKFSQITKKITAGDIALRIDIQRQDELGELAVFFNSMLDQLESRRQLLLKKNAEIKAAQEKLIALEREQTEQQMAGGFAHEMRNALVGPQLLLDKLLGKVGSGVSINLQNSRILKQIHANLVGELPEDILRVVLAQMKTIFANEQKTEEFLGIISIAVTRALSITQQIMKYSKIGYETVGVEDIAIVASIEQVAQQNTRLLQHAEGIPKIVIRLNLSDQDAIFRGQRTHLESIFHNLISNAIDALSDPGVGVQQQHTIDIHGVRENDYYTVNITDNGIGIPQAYRSQLFNCFFSSKPETGTGLGLGVVQKIVKLYGGSIAVDSAVNQWTTFTVTLPVLMVSAD